jgi:small subunit ribosomal protein S8
VINDTISDMLTRLRNASQAKHQIVKIRSTKMTEAIAKILLDEGFILGYRQAELANKAKYILISLKYKRNRTKDPIIKEIQRISRPGLRSYSSYAELPSATSNSKTLIVSTSKGLMTNGQAKNQKIGGEVLCYIW